MRRNELARVTIEKLVFGGAGLGRIGERVAFVWGTLPGEEVEFRKTKKKRNFVEGTLTQVITPSPHRLPPRDDHYLSCSPWQTMAYEEELRWKKLIAAETYRKIGGIELPDTELVTDGREYGYRNKMEYNFIADQAGNLSFAFHAR
ncbi:MAG: TRAM domain-containing protein, partial [Candidatus Magasanikbacteria bacterium]|nr:TRAM domain-containing protein [Candidatus Magasanikbacteria bacterium]